MKKALLAILLLVTTCIAVSNVGAQPEIEFVPNEFILGLANMDESILLEIQGNGGVLLEQIPALKAVRVFVPSESENTFTIAMNSRTWIRYIEKNGIFRAVYTPNDPYWSNLWGMSIIKADLAWDIHKGSTSTLVAVVDTGVDYTHDDLSSRYMALGYDWVNNDNDPKDDHWHGTHVAGTAAAIMDNGIGVTGVAQVSLMAEKVLNSAGSGTWDDVASGITHAADAGADVINLSLGGTGYSQLVADACQYAWNQGSLIIAAAGNSNTNTPFYPAALDTVIAVAATNRYDTKASYSNWGDWIELSAPGGDGSNSNDWILSTYINNGYAWASGTSMATPHVSGLAALVWSYSPTLTNQQLRDHLHNTADDLGNPGKDQYYGYGRINAYRALNELGPAPKMHVGDISMSYTKRGWYSVYTTVPVLSESNAAVSGATVYLDTTLPNGAVQSFIGTTLADGTVTFKVRSKLIGTYVSTVTNVVKQGWVYDPTSNIETSESLTIP